MHKYERGRLLGKGSFGRAVLAKSRADGKQVVIKEVSMRNMKPAEREAANQEAQLLKILKHPNIVSCHESFVEGTTLCIVMDYCSGGDLHVALSERRTSPLTEAGILDYFVQICLALKHLHDKKILHRDVKTQNVFLASHGIVKLGDFGVSKVLDSTTALAATGVGTPYYLSPEICHGRRYNFKTDVWSAGCVLYELACLRRPFEGPDMRTLISKIIRGNYPPAPARYSADLRALIDGMLRREPAQRLSINQVLRRPIMQARIRKFLSESVLHHEFGADAVPRPVPAGVVETARPPHAPPARRSDAAAPAAPPPGPLGGGGRERPAGGAGGAARQLGGHAPVLQEHAEVAQRARQLAARRRAQQQELQQRERERAQEALERQRLHREEQRRRSREGARLMREEFASRQAQALRNKAAAEADRGHVAIYMPPHPRPAAAALDPPGAPHRTAAPQRQPWEGPQRGAGVHGAAVGRRRTEEEQPVGGRASGNGQLSPEQRRVVYLENKRAARRNREALLAQAGAGDLAAFLGVPDAPAGAAAHAPPDAWGPRYSSGGDLDAAAAGGAGDSVRWAPQSTWNGPSLDAPFEPRLPPSDTAAGAGFSPQGAGRLPGRWGAAPPLDLPHAHDHGAAGSGSSVVGAMHGAMEGGSELNVFHTPVADSRGGMEEGHDDGACARHAAVDAQRPQRRSWGGDGAAVGGLSRHMAQHQLVGALDVSTAGAGGVFGDKPRRTAGQREVPPWPHVAEVDLAGWQHAAERHAGVTTEMPQASVAGGEVRAPGADGCRWGEVVEPLVGEGTARQLTAGTGVFATLSRPLTAQGAAEAAPAAPAAAAQLSAAVAAAAQAAAVTAAAVEAAEGSADEVSARATAGDDLSGVAGQRGQGRVSVDMERCGEGKVAAGAAAPQSEQGVHVADDEAAGQVEDTSGRGVGSRGGPPDAAADAGRDQVAEAAAGTGGGVAENGGVAAPHRPSAGVGASVVQSVGDADRGVPQQEGGEQEGSAREGGSDGGGRGGDGGVRNRRSSGGMGAYEAMMRDMAAALRDPGSGGSSLEGSSGSERPPADDAAASGAGGAVKELQGRVSEGRFMIDGQQVELPVGCSASLPQKVEALRVLLESALGTDVFLAAYRHMELLHDGEDAAVAADRLCGLVGPGQESYLQLVQQLILTEEVMHAASAGDA